MTGKSWNESICKLVRLCACDPERFRSSGRAYQVPRRDCIPWNFLTKRMPARCWIRSMAGSKRCMEKFGIHFIHASDEWYILAGRELPQEDSYDGYLQLENGVGMLRLLGYRGAGQHWQSWMEMTGRFRQSSCHRSPGGALY